MAKRIPEKDIRDFIFDNIEAHPSGLAKMVSERFGITRQAVNYRIKKMVEEGLVVASGTTKNKSYSLRPIVQREFSVEISSGVQEHKVWRDLIEPLTKDLRTNVIDICSYGFTEMFNNVIDHSEAKNAHIWFTRLPTKIRIIIADDGIGIFNKIVRDLGLEDNRQAILELAKGKLTTDPKRHTGEGIFFTSRMFDDYVILSGGVYFSHKTGEEEDWILERERVGEGTTVVMSLRNRSDRTVKQVFEKFTASPKDFGFNRTIVPVRLAKHGAEQLVSRSQAKRLLARFERFKVVILDFAGIDEIGQAFADEIFRVYSLQHPEVRIVPANAGPEVKRAIHRAKTGRAVLPFNRLDH